MFEDFTRQEKLILAHSSIGEAAKEIACGLSLTVNTVNTHLKNIKDKVKDKAGKTYKLAEIRFLYVCESMGESSESVKHQIISGVMCLFILLTIPYDHLDKRRYRLRTRRENVEYINEIPAII